MPHWERGGDDDGDDTVGRTMSTSRRLETESEAAQLALARSDCLPACAHSFGFSRFLNKKKKTGHHHHPCILATTPMGGREERWWFMSSQQACCQTHSYGARFVTASRNSRNCSPLSRYKLKLFVRGMGLGKIPHHSRNSKGLRRVRTRRSSCFSFPCLHFVIVAVSATFCSPL